MERKLLRQLSHSAHFFLLPDPQFSTQLRYENDRNASRFHSRQTDSSRTLYSASTFEQFHYKFRPSQTTHNAHARGSQSGAAFCAKMSAAIAQKAAELWLSRRAFQRLTARDCYELSFANSRNSLIGAISLPSSLEPLQVET